MKFTAPALSVFSALAVSAHYCLPAVGTGDQYSFPIWDVVRQTDNYNSKLPLKNVTDPNLRCYNQAGGTAPNTYTATAGTNMTVQTDNNLYHIGVVNVYMAKAPSGVTAKAFDGSGQVWFKIFQITAYPDPNGVNYPVFPALNLYNVTFPIPKNTPNGAYLVRTEHIALHDAYYYGGAQFYISCAQVNVVGGGTGVPGPLVSIPGVYTGYEPGIIFDPYSYPVPTNYTQPGPPVWTG